MRMNTNHFSTLCQRIQINGCNLTNLHRIQGTIAVYHVNTVYRRFCKHLQRHMDIPLLTFGNCHNIAGCLIPLRGSVLNHGNCLRHCIDISSHTNQIHRTVRTVFDTMFVIAASYICHNGDLHISVIVSDDFTNRFIFREFPFSKFVHIKLLFICPVAELHIIHTGFQIRFI